MAGTTAAAHASAQLVQLRQPQPLRVLDHHQAGVGHVHAHFDYRGRHQQCNLAAFEGRHHGSFLGGLHAPVHQADLQPWQGFTQQFGRGFGCLRLQRVTLLDQGAHPVGLAPAGAGAGNAGDNLFAALAVDQHRGHRLAARRQLINDREIQVGVGDHR